MMNLDITFTSLQTTSQRKQLIDFMATQPINYPYYDYWLQRADAEFETGSKSALLAFYQKTLVGNIVSQPDKRFTGLYEIKNFRVHPAVRDRYFARFMLRQIEAEVKKEGKYFGLIGDVRADQPETLEFMLSCGFKKVAVLPLYSDDMTDTVIIKLFDQNKPFDFPPH